MTFTTYRLDEATFTRTLCDPVRDVTATAEAAIDIWPYVAAVPLPDLGGHDITRARAHHLVEKVFRSGDHRFDHVLVPTATSDVFLAVVVDRPSRRVHGHHLLNLRRLYGLD